MKKRDLKFFNYAKLVSYKSTYKRVHIGAVIVRKNQVIAEGANLEKSHPVQKKFDKYNPCKREDFKHFLHAEVAAIIKTGQTDLSDCAIYIYREDKTGKLAMCRPCPTCVALIKAVGIKKIFYSTEEGFCEETIV